MLTAEQIPLVAADRSPPLISTQLAECFKSIALCDYPSQWSGLLPAVVAKLQAKVRLPVTPQDIAVMMAYD